jgi:hypothetical protein
VLALVGGVTLILAFFTPWFSSQGLLLSGQFLHLFLSSAGPSELRQFLPSSSPTEIELLHGLVDAFPVFGGISAIGALMGGLVRGARAISNVLLGVGGIAPLAGWAVGITRLPPGANPEIGLWLIAAGALAILLGLALDLRFAAPAFPRAEISDQLS